MILLTLHAKLVNTAKPHADSSLATDENPPTRYCDSSTSNQESINTHASTFFASRRTSLYPLHTLVASYIPEYLVCVGSLGLYS